MQDLTGKMSESQYQLWRINLADTCEGLGAERSTVSTVKEISKDPTKENLF